MLQNNDNGAYEEFQEINVVLLVSDKQYEEFQETKLDPKPQVVLTDGLLFKGTRLIVPKSLRPEMLRQIRKSHLGIVKCRQSARGILLAWNACRN